MSFCTLNGVILSRTFRGSVMVAGLMKFAADGGTSYAFRLLLPPENDCEKPMFHMTFVPP